ncbi:MAG: Hpt domain-containing protein, partial [Colwellia sp.]|nr:Hpt domain-containing protein [Colwellia sp.]
VLMKSIAEFFFVDLDTQINDLKAYIKAADNTQAISVLHQIKGASANVGGEALSALALEMEKATKAGSVDDIEERVTQLESRFDALKIAMQQAL